MHKISNFFQSLATVSLSMTSLKTPSKRDNKIKHSFMYIYIFFNVGHKSHKYTHLTRESFLHWQNSCLHKSIMHTPRESTLFLRNQTTHIKLRQKRYILGPHTNFTLIRVIYNNLHPDLNFIKFQMQISLCLSPQHL